MAYISPKTLAEIGRLIEKKHGSIGQFCENEGYDKGNISKLLNGKWIPGPLSFDKILKSLGRETRIEIRRLR